MSLIRLFGITIVSLRISFLLDLYSVTQNNYYISMERGHSEEKFKRRLKDVNRELKQLYEERNELNGSC